jgi:hypothetical protein
MTHTAPKLTRDDVAYVLDRPDAVIVLDLATGHVAPDAGLGDPWSVPGRLVLVTHADAVGHHGDAQAAGQRDPLGRAVRVLNLDLYALHARGEIPAAEQHAAELAELLPA